MFLCSHGNENKDQIRTQTLGSQTKMHKEINVSLHLCKMREGDD